MRVLSYIIACTMFLFSGAMPRQTSSLPSSLEKSKQELLELENNWLQGENDPDVLEGILAPDFLHIIPEGIISKSEQLSFMRKHRAPVQRGERHFENMRVRVYGNVGIVNGVAVETGNDEVNRKTLFTDVFAYLGGRWQAVSSQELPAAEKKSAAKCGLQATESRLQNKDPQMLKEVELEWLQAYGERNTSALDCILAEDFEIASMPDEKGEAHSKKHVLDWVATRTPTVQKIERFDLKPYRDVVVVRGIYSMNGQDGKTLARYQYMDVFVFRGERWQALTREIAELPIR